MFLPCRQQNKNKNVYLNNHSRNSLKILTFPPVTSSYEGVHKKIISLNPLCISCILRCILLHVLSGCMKLGNVRYYKFCRQATLHKNVTNIQRYPRIRLRGDERVCFKMNRQNWQHYVSCELAQLKGNYHVITVICKVMGVKGEGRQRAINECRVLSMLRLKISPVKKGRAKGKNIMSLRIKRISEVHGRAFLSQG